MMPTSVTTMTRPHWNRRDRMRSGCRPISSRRCVAAADRLPMMVTAVERRYMIVRPPVPVDDNRGFIVFLPDIIVVVVISTVSDDAGGQQQDRQR